MTQNWRIATAKVLGNKVVRSTKHKVSAIWSENNHQNTAAKITLNNNRLLTTEFCWLST